MTRNDRLRHALGRAVVRYHARREAHGPGDYRSERAGRMAARLAVAWLDSLDAR